MGEGVPTLGALRLVPEGSCMFVSLPQVSVLPLENGRGREAWKAGMR